MLCCCCVRTEVILLLACSFFIVFVVYLANENSYEFQRKIYENLWVNLSSFWHFLWKFCISKLCKQKELKIIKNSFKMFSSADILPISMQNFQIKGYLFFLITSYWYFLIYYIIVYTILHFRELLDEGFLESFGFW